MTEYHYHKDVDNIVTVTLDAAGKSANTMTTTWLAAMYELLDQLRTEPELLGVVLTSAKKTFFAGGDLDDILANEQTPTELMAYVERNKAVYRQLEQLPVPIVAAINGAALGGGYEMCLACNHRIIVDHPKAVVGLPEVKLGLLPGAGGIVRMTAKIGLQAALPLLLEGRQLKPQQAFKAGLVEALVDTQEDLLPTAKAWIKANPDTHVQPWDKRGFNYPGGNADDPKVRMTAALAPTLLYAKTRGLIPAANKIIDIAVNSMRMGFDSALRNESRGFVALVPTPEAKAAITTFFFGMQAIKSGKARPKGDSWRVKQAAIIGAGMMGAGIAWAQASRQIPTVLKDTTLAQAETGKAYSATLADKAIKRGRMDAAQKTALLQQITPTENDADYAGADLIIEAVFDLPSSPLGARRSDAAARRVRRALSSRQQRRWRRGRAARVRQADERGLPPLVGELDGAQLPLAHDEHPRRAAARL